MATKPQMFIAAALLDRGRGGLPGLEDPASLDGCRERVMLHLPRYLWPRFLEPWAALLYESAQLDERFRRLTGMKW